MSTAESNKAEPQPTVSEAPAPAANQHPSQRWETAFVYAFICKFTNLRKNVEGFETPMDFEQALMFSSSDPIIKAILTAFIQNLKPGSRDPRARIEKSLSNVIDEFCNKEYERSLWWDGDARRNFNPLVGTLGFFSIPWDEKLDILRQLVEWQLAYSNRIRDMLDLAWGVKAAKHQKKADKDANAPPPPEHPESKESLRLDPYGQDVNRKRFWVLDDSPRIYQSGNPWKLACTFDAISTSRSDFISVLEDLKGRGPQVTEGEEPDKTSRTRLEQSHLNLIQRLENEQLPIVDAEIARVEKARNRFEQKLLLAAQVEVRPTRTRRQTTRPDYVYGYNEGDDNDDEYAYNTPDDDFIDEMDVDEDAGSYVGSSSGMRRSSRTAVVNTRKRASEGANGRNKLDGYRGERRSTRLGNAPVVAFDESEQALLPQKRARSNISDISEAVAPPPPPDTSTSEAPNRLVVVPPPLGKKKSRFWFYAVEPGPGSSVSGEATPTPALVGGAAGGAGGGNSAALSETSTSLVDAMDGVGLTDANQPAQQLTNDASTNGNTDHHNGLNSKPKRGLGSGSDMSMSDGES